MTEGKILNRDVIKYAAMVTMLLNHIANVFLDAGTVLCTVLLDVGYFTAPVMCYFLVEGWHYTHSRRQYAKRLALFALLSEVPFCLAFSQVYNGVEGISFCGFNMIFTLLLCFGVLCVREQAAKPGKRTLLLAGLVLLSVFSDWAVIAPLMTLWFARAWNDPERLKNAFALSAFLFALLNFQPGISGMGIGGDLFLALCSAAGIAAAGFVLLRLYNGKRMERGRTFSKWFFYVFYPAHLLVLGLIRLAV